MTAPGPDEEEVDSVSGLVQDQIEVKGPGHVLTSVDVQRCVFSSSAGRRCCRRFLADSRRAARSAGRASSHTARQRHTNRDRHSFSFRKNKVSDRHFPCAVKLFEVIWVPTLYFNVSTSFSSWHVWSGEPAGLASSWEEEEVCYPGIIYSLWFDWQLTGMFSPGGWRWLSSPRRDQLCCRFHPGDPAELQPEHTTRLWIDQHHIDDIVQYSVNIDEYWKTAGGSWLFTERFIK